MSESMNPLQNLFKAGITKEQFVQQYKELANSDSKDIALIFNFNNGITAEDVFDTLNINAKEENILEEADLQNLAQKYKEDGNNVISDNDITILYNEIYGQKSPQKINEAVIKQFEKENIYGFEDPQARHDNAVLLNVRSLEYQIEAIDMLIENQKLKSKKKIELLEQRISNEILKNNELDIKFKEDYEKQVNKKKKNENELKTKQNEIEKEQNKETPNSDKIEKLNSEIRELKSKNASITTNIKAMRNTISNAQIKSYESQIKQEEENCQKQIEQYNILKENIINTQNLAIEAALSEMPSSNETIPIEDSEDENIIVTHDAKKLTQAWNSKKGVNLSESFVQKTMQVADNIGCDANDLLALMYSESSFRHDVQNNIGATGLIQFMPKTAKSLGTTTEALKKMSPEKQLDYVEKFFLKNKATFGMNGKKMSAGDLYAITFLPARAKNNVLTTSDEKYYKFNKGLDTNKDGKITTQDLSQRLRKYIPDAARRA